MLLLQLQSNRPEEGSLSPTPSLWAFPAAQKGWTQTGTCSMRWASHGRLGCLLLWGEEEASYQFCGFSSPPLSHRSRTGLPRRIHAPIGVRIETN